MGNTSSSSCSPNQPIDLRADTSSACMTKVATGIHNFVVTNYSLLDGMGVGKFVQSSPFKVGDYYWCILFYPDGALQEHAGYAAAYVCLLSGVAGTTGVRVKFTLSLHEEGGTVHRGSSVLTATHTFKSAADSWGTPRVVHKSKLQADVFTIRCDLTILQHTNVEMILPEEIAVSPAR